jgi:hypothetical protein
MSLSIQGGEDEKSIFYTIGFLLLFAASGNAGLWDKFKQRAPLTQLIKRPEKKL